MRSAVDPLFWLRIVIFALWLVGSAALGWVLLIYGEAPLGGSRRDVPFYISDADSLETVAERLRAERVIRDPRLFVVYVRLRGLDAELKRGYVPVHQALSPSQLVPRLLRTGIQVSVRVVIPEGFNHFDIATRLARLGITDRTSFLTAARDRALLDRLGIRGPSAEGYLFPATYELRTDSRAADVVQRLVQAFRRNTRESFAQLATARQSGKSLLNDEQALILASIVEEEAQAAEERPTIAGTFLNRLLDPSFVPHRLQADPTVAYGCLIAPERAGSCLTFDGRRVTPQMVRDPDNPYNTYRIEGLPPGPISNPGLASLRAAIEPEQHDYFYFVASGGGRHTFSHSLDEHNEAVSGSR